MKINAMELSVNLICAGCGGRFIRGLVELPACETLKCPVCGGTNLGIAGEGELCSMDSREDDYWDDLDWEPERPPVIRHKIKL